MARRSRNDYLWIAPDTTTGRTSPGTAIILPPALPFTAAFSAAAAASGGSRSERRMNYLIQSILDLLQFIWMSLIIV
jgi:hypothetical protein